MRQLARDRVGPPTASLSSYLLLPVSQQRAQTSTPVKHFRSHRAFGDPEDPGDFSMGVTLDIEQDHRGATPLRQLSEGGAQPLAQLALDRDRIGSWTTADQRRIERLGSPDVATPASISGGVRDDPHQPGPERPARIVLTEPHQGGEKPGPRPLLPIVRITQHPPGPAPRPARLPGYENP